MLLFTFYIAELPSIGAIAMLLFTFYLLTYKRCRPVLQHCQFEMFSYTKDLSTIGSDLSSTFIIDNSPGAYKSYPGM